MNTLMYMRTTQSRNLRFSSRELKNTQEMYEKKTSRQEVPNSVLLLKKALISRVLED